MSEQPRFSMPCMQSGGLNLFSVTANQREGLGAELFLETHLPIHLLRRKSHIEKKISEEDLLKEILLKSEIAPGNRVFILFGAAGSGKSELMAWLEMQLKQHDPSIALARITRTDLDALAIIERFRHWLTNDYFARHTHDRWKQMRQKPRTLAKLLVLQTLENLLDSDELINALYYRLVDLIEVHIRDVLQIEPQEDIRSVDILSRREFEQLVADTALTVPLAFEPFRQTLLTNLVDYLLEGTRIQGTLQDISLHISALGKRPTLLIDDLVQSISIFATDFLDYFITLESGNWDVVIGLTPAALQEDPRHRELLERITYLDTIDDRVQKLWLSDEDGSHSFFLNEENCHELAYAYLQVFRRLNGWLCTDCPALKRCQSLEDTNQILAPFTRNAIIRIYRSLPNNKGRVRYFLMVIRSILSEWLNGASFDTVTEEYIQRDLLIECPDRELRALLTWYAPLDLNTETLVANPDVIAFFGYAPVDVIFPVQKLTEASVTSASKAETFARSLHDPVLMAVSDWLDGKPVNRQLLHNLRKGIAKWLKAIVPVEYHYRDGIAQPTKVLRYHRVEMGTSPPIRLQDVDNYGGISVTQDIGHAAFQFVRYFQATGEDAKMLEYQLSRDVRTLALLTQASAVRAETNHMLENTLGEPMPVFALQAYIVILVILEFPDNISEIVNPAFVGEIKILHTMVDMEEITKVSIPIRNLYELAERLFKDYFQLRQNLYDVPLITELLAGTDTLKFVQHITSINTTTIDDNFRIGNLPLSQFVKNLQICIQAIYVGQRFQERLSQMTIPESVSGFIQSWQRGEPIPHKKIRSSEWRIIRQMLPEFYAKLQVVFDSEM